MKTPDISNTSFLMLIIVITNAIIGELTQTQLESWISKKTVLLLIVDIVSIPIV
jgi:hypothetical protein